MKTFLKIISCISILSLVFWTNSVSAAAVELFSMSLYNDANLLAYYRLEDLVDSEDSGTDYDLTNNNSVTFVAAKFNNGGQGAATKSLSVGSAMGLIATSDVSYTFWVKLDTEISANFYQFLVHYWGTNTPIHMIRYDYNAGTRRINFYSGNYTGSYQHSITMGTTDWYHLAMTRVGSTGAVRAYVNGVDVGGFTDANTDTNAAKFELLGQGGINNVIGIMDDVAVFDRVLTATEISDIYNGVAAAATGEEYQIIFE